MKTTSSPKNFREAFLALKAEHGLKPKPEIYNGLLSLNLVNLEPLVFQPRGSLSQWESELHTHNLQRAIKASPDNRLEPIAVFWSGLRWVLTDGHHRLSAYQMARDDGYKIEAVPAVDIEQDTALDAMRYSLASNSRNKLAMSQRDKFEGAWRLVLNANCTVKEVAVASGVSERTIKKMRSIKRAPEEWGISHADLYEIDYHEIKSNGWQPSEDAESLGAIETKMKLAIKQALGKQICLYPQLVLRACLGTYPRYSSQMVEGLADELDLRYSTQPNFFDIGAKDSRDEDDFEF